MHVENGWVIEYCLSAGKELCIMTTCYRIGSCNSKSGGSMERDWPEVVIYWTVK